MFLSQQCYRWSNDKIAEINKLISINGKKYALEDGVVSSSEYCILEAYEMTMKYCKVT